MMPPLPLLQPTWRCSSLVSRHGRAALLLTCAITGLAGTPSTRAADSAASQIAGWTQDARTTDPAFVPSETRGRQFFLRRNPHSADMPSCATCHTESPAAAGRHVVTGKAIGALAPQVNPQRFVDAAKTEKWFKRNCNDVLGRVCTAGEKADLVAFLATLR